MQRRLQPCALSTRVQQGFVDETQLLRALDHRVPLCPQMSNHCSTIEADAARVLLADWHVRWPAMPQVSAGILLRESLLARQNARAATAACTSKARNARSSIRVIHSTCCSEKVGCAASQPRRRRTTSIVMYVPVRPTPALQCTQGTPGCACRFCILRTHSHTCVIVHDARSNVA